MLETSQQMGVESPSYEDLEAVMEQLDEDFDGVIDKNEFHKLLMLVIEKMIETEMQFQNECNEEFQRKLKAEKQMIKSKESH